MGMRMGVRKGMSGVMKGCVDRVCVGGMDGVGVWWKG